MLGTPGRTGLASFSSLLFKRVSDNILAAIGQWQPPCQGRFSVILQQRYSADGAHVHGVYGLDNWIPHSLLTSDAHSGSRGVVSRGSVESRWQRGNWRNEHELRFPGKSSFVPVICAMHPDLSVPG